jgi:Cu-processing system permease protein
VPIIGIVLGYNTITGEAESGSLLVVLSNPIRRIEVLVGKFIGLGAVLSTSTLLGFGIAGAVILAQDSSNAAGYLIFIMLSLLLGLIYMSLSICFSAIMKRTTTALGAGIGIFFWGMIMGTIIFGIYLASGGSTDSLISGYPDWMWAATVLFSPADMFQTSVMMGFGMTDLNLAGFSVSLPNFITPALLAAIYAAWIMIPMAAGYHFFRKRDI